MNDEKDTSETDGNVTIPVDDFPRPVYNYPPVSTNIAAEFEGVDHIIVCTMWHDIFIDFIHTPSFSLLKNSPFVYVEYTKNSNAVGVFISHRGEYTYEFKSGGRIGTDIPLYYEFVDFAGSLSNWERYLLENGVEATVAESVILVCRAPDSCYIPVTIWLNTDKGDYFVTISENRNSELVGHGSENFVYRLYTQEAYVDKYKTKTGTVSINGITLAESVIFWNRDFYAPFEAIIKGMGIQLRWNPETKEATLRKDDRIIILKFDQDFYHFQVFENDKELYSDNYSKKPFYFGIPDDEIMLLREYLSRFVQIFGGTLLTHSDDLNIEITMN